MNEKAEELREQLIEAAAEADDELMEKYLEEDPLSEDESGGALRKGIITGTIVPVLCGSATMNYGIQQLLDQIVNSFPSPADREPWIGKVPGEEEETIVKQDENEPFSAFFFKTIAEPK